MKRLCNFCQTEYDFEPRYVNRGQGLFCSQSCSSSRPKKKTQTKNCVCGYCSTPLYRSPSKLKSSKSGLVFCNRQCKEAGQSLSGGLKEIQPGHYGTATVPNYSFAKKEYCENCGYNKIKEILHVHHIDRDRSNATPSNLICLCPNCHDETHFESRSGRFIHYK